MWGFPHRGGNSRGRVLHVGQGGLRYAGLQQRSLVASEEGSTVVKERPIIMRTSRCTDHGNDSENFCLFFVLGPFQTRHKNSPKFSNSEVQMWTFFQAIL